MRQITVYKNYGKSIVYATVDDDLFDILNEFRWTLRAGYARAWDYENEKNIYMHRFIAQTPEGMVTDHINRVKLDNRRENLRVCTPEQNSINRIGPTGCFSEYTGVQW